MFHFLPIAVRYDGSGPAAGHGYQVHIGPMYSDSRGLGAHHDRLTCRSSRRCASTTSRRRRTGGSGSRRSATPATSSPSRRSPRSTVASCHRGRRSRATRRSSTGSPATPRRHCTRRALAGWASTTSPSLDPDSLRVHGLRGIRVVDASSMPYVTNGNIYAPVMMLAEKAADLITGATRSPRSPSTSTATEYVMPSSTWCGGRTTYSTVEERARVERSQAGVRRWRGGRRRGR